MSKIYPVLLAGGSGTRLWPLSRKSYPKQFSKVICETTLFQSSANRLISSEIVQFNPPITMTNSDYRFIVGEQLQEIGIDPGPILIEPEAKNTAAAILAATLCANLQDENAVLLVAPSDHVISDNKAFHQAISTGLRYAREGKIVTFGIQPLYPETGYGYLELSADVLGKEGASNLLRFVEKPNLKAAQKMIGDGNFLWNAGIFLFRAQDMIDAFKAFAPETLELVFKSVNEATPDLGFLRLAVQPWTSLDEISIDYAIMEKAQNIVAIPYLSKWSDLGGWDAVWSASNPDLNGNVISTSAHAIECTNTLLRSESNSQQIVGLGLDSIVAIAMPDAVLVAKKDRVQDIKKAVNLLLLKKIPQADTHPKDHRPWGWFESLVIENGFRVKRIFVKPGGILSLQTHAHRSEHWIVVEGIAKVTINDEVQFLSEGQSVFVPVGVKHRLENSTANPMEIIEVQLGSYLGEDDIVRLEDVYAREQ